MEHQNPSESDQLGESTLWYLNVYLVSQLKIFLTSLETPTYTENTANKKTYIFWPLLVPSRAAESPKLNSLRAN